MKKIENKNGYELIDDSLENAERFLSHYAWTSISNKLDAEKAINYLKLIKAELQQIEKLSNLKWPC